MLCCSCDCCRCCCAVASFVAVAVVVAVVVAVAVAVAVATAVVVVFAAAIAVAVVAMLLHLPKASLLISLPSCPYCCRVLHLPSGASAHLPLCLFVLLFAMCSLQTTSSVKALPTNTSPYLYVCNAVLSYYGMSAQ